MASISVMYLRAMEFIGHVGKGTPLPEHYEACVEFDAGPWSFAFNPHRDERRSSRASVPGYGLLIFKCDWPAGVVLPHGGSLLMPAAEGDIIAALEAAIRDAGHEPEALEDPKPAVRGKQLGLWGKDR